MPLFLCLRLGPFFHAGRDSLRDDTADTSPHVISSCRLKMAEYTLYLAVNTKLNITRPPLLHAVRPRVVSTRAEIKTRHSASVLPRSRSDSETSHSELLLFIGLFIHFARYEWPCFVNECHHLLWQIWYFMLLVLAPSLADFKIYFCKCATLSK